MKKNIVFKNFFFSSLVFAAAVVGSGSVLAAPEFDLKGAARFRYEDLNEYGATANSFLRSAFSTIRIRPNLNVKVDGETQVVFEPQFLKILGRDYSYTQTDSSGAKKYNEALHIHQGYIQTKLTDELTFVGGREAIDYGGGIIIGRNDGSIWARAFDLAKLTYIDSTGSFAKIDFVYSTIKNTASAIDADKNLSILYTQWKLSDVLTSTDVYALYETDLTSGRNEYRHAEGLRLTGKADQIDASIEATIQQGSSGYQASGTTGTMFFGELGQSFPEIMKLRLGLEFNMANENWIEWYPTTKPLMGRNDIVGRRNLMAMGLRLAVVPSDSVTIKLDLWNYARVSDAQTAYRVDGLPVGSTTASDSKDIGNAIEFSVLYKKSENVDLGLGLAYLAQGKYLKDNFGDRAITDGYALVAVRF